MKIEITINNYQIGSRMRMTPTHKIVEQIRIDKLHTKIVYDNITENEKQFIEKVYAKKSKTI